MWMYYYGGRSSTTISDSQTKLSITLECLVSIIILYQNIYICLLLCVCFAELYIGYNSSLHFASLPGMLTKRSLLLITSVMYAEVSSSLFSVCSSIYIYVATSS